MAPRNGTIAASGHTLRRGLAGCLGALALFFSTPAFAGLGASVSTGGNPTTIYPSQTTQMVITLSNNNTLAPIGSVAFSNTLPGTLPNGLKITGAATYTCTDPATNITSAGSGSLTATVGTQAISLSGGVIPARANSTDGTCTISIPITAGTSTGNATNYTYSIANGAVTGNDGGAVANSGLVSQGISISALTAPTISKTFGASTLTLGGASTTLTITVTNTNPVAIPNFTITDNFPLPTPLTINDQLIKVAATPGATSTCNLTGTPATFNPSAGDKSLSATAGTIAAKSGATNGTCTITVQVEANHTNDQYQTSFVNNTITGASFTNDIGIVPANASAQVRTLSPLAVVKSFAHNSIASGQSDTFTVKFTNNGSTDLTITGFTDNPIDGSGGTGLTLNSVPTMTCSSGSSTPGQFVYDGSNVGFTQDGAHPTTIAAGTNCTITASYTGVVQTPNTPISYTNSIGVGTVSTSPSGVVNQADSASVLVADALQISNKAITPTAPGPGEPVRYQVTVRNWSASALSNVAITDTLSNGQKFLTGIIGLINFTPTMTGSGCSGISTSSPVDDTAPVLTIGTVPARSLANSFTPGACVVTFWAMTDKDATNNSNVVNSLGPTTVCYDPGGGPICNADTATSNTSHVNTAILSAVKSFTPVGPLSEGTVTRMRITLSNISANPLTGTTISDNLPTAAGGGQMRIATPPNAATTCTGSPSITAVADSDSIAMNGATVPARANNGIGAASSCFLEVDVVAPAGFYSNTASTAATQTYANGLTNALGTVTANASITYTSSLSATKSFVPSSVSSGGKSTVTVRLSNGGSVPLTNVSVTDALPTGMVLANPVNGYSTCAGSPIVTGAAGASSITISGASIAASGTCDMLFDVVATGGSNWVNTIPIGNITADGGISNQSAVTATLTNNAATAVSVSKATNPSTITFPGQVSQLTVTLTNGATPVTNLHVTDYFTMDGTVGGGANGMQVAPTTGATTNCPGGVVTAVPSAASVAISGVSLGASASCTFSVNVSSTTVGGITNYIPVGAIATDQGLSNSGQASTSLTTQGNLGITKQFTPNVVTPGERSRLRITFYNPTAQPVTALGVTDTLPSGLTVPVGPNATTTCTGGSVTSPASDQVQLSGGTMDAASGGVTATCYVEIDVVGAAEGDYVNTIAASSVTAMVGGVSASNSQPTSDTLRVKDPIVVHKAIDSKTLDAGNPAGFTTATATKLPGVATTLTISLTNSNSQALTQASFTDIFPTGLVVAQTPSASTTCSGGVVTAPASATQISLASATIPANGSCTVSVNVLSNITNTYTNTLAAGSITTYEGVTNVEPSSARLVVPTAPSVSKQFSPPVIASGGTSTMTIFFTNDNSVAGTLSSVFTDTLPTAPGNVVVAPTPAVSKTCPGTVTAAAGAATVTYASGATIPAGGCTISVNVTATAQGVHTNNIPINALQTTELGNNAQAANATLTVSQLGFIAGKVFRDNNLTPNGTFDIGTDTIISGVSIELRSGADCTGSLLDTQTTDTAGNYLFSGLNANTVGTLFSVCQPSQPSSTKNGITTAGAIVSSSGSTGTPGTASDIAVTPSQIIGIVLNNDGAGSAMSGSTGNNFAETVASTISGTVFTDQNNNGTQNGADSGIAGVTVDLLNSGGSLITSTTTDSSGNYSFGSLDPGTYSVREPSQPSGTSNGITTAGSVGNGGTAGTATGLTTLPSRINTIILPPNTAASGNNFAEIPNNRSVRGSVFYDSDDDGAKNGSDTGVSGYTLSISGTDVNGNAFTANAVTDASGNYNFSAVPEGTYTITEPTQPANSINGTTTAGSTGGTATNLATTPSAIANLDLTGANTVSANNDFAEMPNDRSISGTVFADGNADGVKNGGETGINGISIALTGTDVRGNSVSTTATTDSNGDYSFTGLLPGTYTLNQSAQPSGTANGTTTAGSAGGTATNPTSTTSRIASFSLVTTSTGNNFAEIPNDRSVSGTVFLDGNDNGIKNGGEAGISSVTIALTGTDIASNPVSTSTTTDVNGDYSFTGLLPGTYTVSQAAQPANTTNGTTTASATGGGVASNPTATSSQVATIVLTGGAATSSGNNFAEVPNTRSISGSVFYDYNNNGVSNGSDFGISGVTIDLTGTDIAGTAVSASTTTDGSGNFSFTNIAPGTYTLDQSAQPANTVNGTATAGSTGGTATNPTSSTSRIATIPLSGANTTSTGNNFAEVPGNAPDLTVTKIHTPATFAEGSSNGVFTLTPNNLGSVASSGTITIVDTLPAGMTLAAPATGTGWSCIGAVGASSVSCTSSTVIGAAISGSPISLRVLVANGTNGQTLINNATISGGSEPALFNYNNSTDDSVLITLTASVSGKVWRDLNHNRIIDGSEPLESGWTVELLLSGSVVNSTTTNGSGAYSFTNVIPGSGYQLRFRAPGSGLVYGNAVTNEQGITPTGGTRDTGGSTNNGTNSGNPAGGTITGDGTLRSLTFLAGDNIVEQSLPLDPEGIVYDAATRAPVAGAEVTISGPGGFNPAIHLVGGTAVETTGADGMYQFLLMPAAPAGTYTLAVTGLPTGYHSPTSTTIPACNNTVTVANLPDPALIQTSATAPVLSAPVQTATGCPASTAGLAAGNQATTQYYYNFNITPGTSANVVNNHLPIEPLRATDIVISKTTPLVNVNIGQLVPYTITVHNTTGAAFTDIDIRDVIPAGFKYKKSSATRDGVALEPTVNGRNLTWPSQSVAASATRTYKLILVVGAGVQPGEYVNSVRAVNNPGSIAISNVATATVRVIPDPLFDCSEIIGKVFDDKNANGYQDDGEPGIANVRMATVNGLLVTSDAEGRFHIACAAIPDADRGSNFLLKLDERTLPTGYRVTTENPRDVRLTRGKMTKLNFGATIHKVIRIDMRSDAFEPGTTTLKPEWLQQMQQLPEALKARPSVVRLGYAASPSEDVALARKRLKAMSAGLKKIWQEQSSGHALQIEEELVTAPTRGAP